MVLGQGDASAPQDATCPPIVLPLNARSSAPLRQRVAQKGDAAEALPCDLNGGGGEDRNGDGYQSPQTQYFDPVYETTPSSNLEESAFCLPDASTCAAEPSPYAGAESDQYCNSSPGAMGSTDGSFALVPPGATLFRLVPCVPVVVHPVAAWANPFMVGASAKSRAFNRTAKRRFSKDAPFQFGSGAWSAKGDPRPFIFSGGAASAAAAAKAKASGRAQQHRGHTANVTEHLQAQRGEGEHPEPKVEKRLDRPSAVFVDLSCLRPQHRARPLLAH